MGTRIIQLGLLATLLGAGAAQAAGDPGQEDPVALAQERYQQARSQGVDLSAGPCLGEIKPGWVADIAHQPRLPVDDRPENQCAAYRSGQDKHFVELDPQGNLIRQR